MTKRAMRTSRVLSTLVWSVCKNALVIYALFWMSVIFQHQVRMIDSVCFLYFIPSSLYYSRYLKLFFPRPSMASKLPNSKGHLAPQVHPKTGDHFPMFNLSLRFQDSTLVPFYKLHGHSFALLLGLLFLCPSLQS